MPAVFIAATAAPARAAAWEFTPDALVLAAPGSSRAWKRIAGAKNLEISAPEAWFERQIAQKLVAPADRAFLLAGVVADEAQNLECLGGLANSGEFVAEFSLLVSDMRRAARDEIPLGGDWCGDLTRLWKAYNARLRQLGAFDAEAAPALFCDATSQKFPANLVLDLLPGLAPVLRPALRLLLEKADLAAGVLVVPGLENSPRNWDELEKANPCAAVKDLIMWWRETGAEFHFCASLEAKKSRILAASQILGARQDAPTPPEVVLTQAHTPWDEMSRIAAHMARETPDKNWDEWTLALPDAARYGGVLEAAFAAHAVPVRVARSRPRTALPVVRRLLKLLSLAPADWDGETLFDLFGDRILQLCEGQATFDARRLRAASLAARVYEFSDGQKAQIALEAAQKRLRDKEREQNFLARDDKARLAVIGSCLEAGDFACLASLQNLGGGVRGPKTPGEWEEAALKIIERATGHLAARDDETAQTARQQAQIVTAAIESVAARVASWSGEKARRGGDWADWLRLELERPEEAFLGPQNGVRVVGLGAAEADAGGKLFLAGLLEGDWPRGNSPGSLFARQKAELAPLRQHLPPPAARAAYQFARALSDSQTLFLSYPANRDDRETLRAPLLEDFLVAWGQNWPSLASLDSSQPTSRAQVLTRESQQSAPESSHLARLAQMRLERTGAEILGRFDGNLGEVGAGLMSQFFALPEKQKRLSPSSLEDYARCPLKFFFRNVLELRGASVFQADLPPNEQGELLHKILERFHKNYRAPLRLADWAEFWPEIAGIVREEVRRLSIRPVLREAELCRLIGRDEKTGLLAKILRAECRQSEGWENGAWIVPLTPVSEALESKIEHFQLDGFQVTGRLDRMDRAADGSVVAILDYKSSAVGSLPWFKGIENGLDFQIVLYLLEARARFGNLARLAAAYFSLRDASWARGLGQIETLGRKMTQNGPGKQFVQSGAHELADDEFHALLDEVAARVVQIAALLDAGQFHLSLHDAATAKCRNCDFRAACGQNAEFQPQRRKFWAGKSGIYWVEGGD